MAHYEDILRMEEEERDLRKSAMMRCVLADLTDARDELIIPPDEKPTGRLNRIMMHIESAIDLARLEAGEANDGFLPER